MATLGKLFLFVAFARIASAQAYPVYPDSRGVEFIVGYMANDVLKMPVQLFVTTSRDFPVNVTVTAPMFPEAGLNEVFNVTSGEVKQLFINNTIRAVGTRLETKGIVVTASDEVVVYGTNMEKYSNDAFLGFPVDVLGNNYYTVSHYPSEHDCEFLVVGVYDSTNVTIRLGTHPNITVRYNRRRYYSNDVIQLAMNRLDTMQTLAWEYHRQVYFVHSSLWGFWVANQVQSEGDLTGTHIEADKDVVVYSGNRMTSVRGTSRDHLVDQMLPVQTWGKQFVTVPIPDRLIVKPGDEVKFIASENDTVVDVDCSGGFSEPADPSLITIPPVEQYASEYTLATPKYSKGIYQNFAMIIVEKNLRKGLRIDDVRVRGLNYTSVPGTRFVGTHIEVSDGTHNFRHVDESVFGLFMYGTAKWETYGMPGGLSLAHINGYCGISYTPTDGDGIDNDCDDLIDEEICSPENNGTDDDGDGLIDEDCALPPPIDGNWTMWSNWTACSVSCTPHGDNVLEGTQSRYRNCSNPTPQYGGFACIGHDIENATCLAITTCPVHGNWSTWGSWSSCTGSCGNGTYTRSRSCSDPAPDYGGNNCTGALEETGVCDTAINCPIDGGWGSWSTWGSCSVSCGSLGGISVRNRSCDSPEPAYGGANCTGDSHETTTCNVFNCPVDGNWAVWSSWSSCGVTCGESTVYRNRSCTDPEPQYNGTDCVGSDSESTSCYAGTDCPGWSDWSTWESCSSNCGPGTSTRNRTCGNPDPLNAGCVGADAETVACSGPCSAIDGNWTNWSSWSSCGVTCGNSTVFRTRSCSEPEPQYNGTDCVGSGTESTDCYSGTMCQGAVLILGWSEWSTWESCSNDCGAGTSTRSRTCGNPDPYNTDCVGADTQTAVCTGTCSVHGGWGSWDDWSSCTHSCDGGRRLRVRICDTPVPTPDGRACFGDAIESEMCNTRACTGSLSWTSDGQNIGVCPDRYFACRTGGVSCIEQDFRCDCELDCEDGSDESPDWGACSDQLHTFCGERNLGETLQTKIGIYFTMCVFVMKYILHWVT